MEHKGVTRSAGDEMGTDFHHALEELCSAVLKSAGETSHETREAAFHGAVQDTQVGLYLEKVREQSYRVVDNDFQILRDAGLSEDAIFELTVAAALGAAVRRLNSRLLAVGVTS